ncbi:MAG: D-tyrosyl-tRNA(Tyr) deacylase [candidate division Zixibacteria bacterium]|nr:D-tyrosyl-tRNA(Tyr) deacylase [candidate division Zixibacteria bacterium]
MRAVIQRVKSASVRVDGETVSSTGVGMLVLLGAGQGDTEDNVRRIADKIMQLRVFEDREGKMNLSAKSVGGEFMVVSQFTLYGDTSKGRRPSFTGALKPDEAERLYEKFVEYLRENDFIVGTGVFGERMEVELINEGPVTFIIEDESRE